MTSQLSIYRNTSINSVQLLRYVWFFVTQWTTACQASLSITNSWSLLKLMSDESVITSDHLILCRPTLLLPSIFPSSGSFSMSQFFASGGQSIGLSASAPILPMNIQDCLFRIDWLDLIAVQGTFKSLLQHHSSKASILWCSALFIVQLSHLYMITGETIAITRQALVSKVMAVLFNMLSRWVIAFLPRSKCLLISWLQSPSAVI